MRLDLFGVVGEDFTPTTVRAALPYSGDITVAINSGGGIAVDGSAIYNILSGHRGKVHVEIIGIAASAASLIAMAGHTITMLDGSILMIHEPHNFTYGDSDAHQRTVEQLEAHAVAYAKVYAKRAGISEAAARQVMKAETWYTPDEAVAAGFATAVVDRLAVPFARVDKKYEARMQAVHARAAASPRGLQKVADTKASWARVVAAMNKSMGFAPAAPPEEPKPKVELTGWAKIVEANNAFVRRHR
ncbi:head maturation protease, ClpP-related [Shinella granuli]|uniref:ATP-dependent Clp protease proteolytic subunit n=1 Tax=Shinella granuli TaxID=323621 RepID=A0A4R2BX99_SHIGR|nr:head maturation protease, ClpP-related [Shinella granuli]TCN31632.1 ATP-dependent protease ClpP protease subunit [Shinella granuli]